MIINLNACRRVIIHFQKAHGCWNCCFVTFPKGCSLFPHGDVNFTSVLERMDVFNSKRNDSNLGLGLRFECVHESSSLNRRSCHDNNNYGVPYHPSLESSASRCILANRRQRLPICHPRFVMHQFHAAARFLDTTCTLKMSYPRANVSAPTENVDQLTTAN